MGSPGQFDVLLDGERVAGRDAGFLSRLLGGGWPDPEDVVEIVRAKQGAR